MTLAQQPMEVGHACSVSQGTIIGAALNCLF